MHLFEETHSPSLLSRSQSGGYYQNQRTAQHVCVATRFSHTFCQHRRPYHRLYLDPEKERACVFVFGERRTKMSLHYSIVLGIGRNKMDIFHVHDLKAHNHHGSPLSSRRKKMAKWACFNYQASNPTLILGPFTNKGPHYGVYCRRANCKMSFASIVGFLIPRCTCFKPFTT
jgi:hypothetical protein